MRKYNIVNPKKYTVSQTGEEKTFYAPVGEITIFEAKGDKKESGILKLHGMNNEYVVFPFQPKPGKQSQGHMTDFPEDMVRHPEDDQTPPDWEKVEDR